MGKMVVPVPTVHPAGQSWQVHPAGSYSIITEPPEKNLRPSKEIALEVPPSED